LVEGFSYGTAYGVATRMGAHDFGNAIASRWPLQEVETILLPSMGSDESRCAIGATIDSPFGELAFTCTHLNWKLHDARTRQRQVVALADFVLRRRPKGGFPPVVVGDFNAEPDSDEIRFMRGFATLDERSVMFYDAWSLAGDGGPGYTWSNRNAFAAIALEPERRIDYVFSGYPIRMTDDHGVGKVEVCRVVCDDDVDGVWPSDHFGVYAEFKTEPLGRPRIGMG
jgi:endonuclease/exonuclease/phosphatase family metal-dependent hydrolase